MRIKTHVYVMHPETGSHLLSPGVVPEWAESLISNPDVLEGEFSGASEQVDETSEVDPVTEAVESEPEETPIPPKSGRGSSAEAWAAYAASKGFDVEADAKASEIREALEAEGIPTE